MSSYGGRGPTLNAVLWFESGLAAVFVLARCYTRRFILRSAGLDDLCLLLTLILLVVYSACISAGTAFGIGQKRADIPPADYTEAMKLEIIAQGVCIFNIVTSKASVGFLLLRIVTRAWHRVFIWFILVTNSIMATFLTIAVFIQCIPVQSVWDHNVKGNCWLDFTTTGITVSAYAVCVDFALAIIPCFIVWELNMKKKDKIITACGLSLGVFAGICGIMRTTALTSMKSMDQYIFDTVDMLIYSGTENFVSALCASIPVIRPLWSKVVHGYISSEGSYPSRSYHLSDMQRSGDAERYIGGEGGGSGARGPETRIYARGFKGVSDNNSEDSILRDTRTGSRGDKDVGNGIFCQTEIRVNSTRSGREDLASLPHAKMP